jgi:general stress protein 26
MTTDTERAWELAKKIGFCMLASHDGGVIRSRPMAAHVDKDAGTILFLTDARSHKDDEIAANPQVDLAFADTSGHNYVSINGNARISSDKALIKELWSTPAKAWWDNPDDPNIRVLIVDPQDAQFWDGPGKVAAMIKMVMAAASDKRPDMGENKKVSM